jgi:hypothetical protein
MKQVFNDCLGKTKQQIFDYCISKNVDIDTIFAVGEMADKKMPKLKGELRALDGHYEWDSSCGAWCAPDYIEDEYNEIENKIEKLQNLRSDTEEVYNMLDDYYYERQTF